MEDELRILVTQYSETKTELNQLQRKRGNNLNSGPLEEILRSDVIEKATGGKPKSEVFLSGSSFLQTALVVIRKSNEDEFLSCYETIGSNDVSFNLRGPDATSEENNTNSPVVPRSAT